MPVQQHPFMNIDARSAGPPSFVCQLAIYQPNPKAVNHRWSSRRAGVWSRSEAHNPDPLEKGVLCPFVDPRHAARAWGEGQGRMRRRDPRWRVYKAWPAAKQPHQERLSRACEVVGGAQGCVPRGANGEMLCTSSRSGVQEIMRTIVAVAGAAHCVRTVTMMTCEGQGRMRRSD